MNLTPKSHKAFFMTWQRKAVCAVVLLWAWTGLSAAEEFALPKPAPVPTTKPFVPETEKSFYEPLMQVVPGVRHWVMWQRGTLMHFSTTQSVGDGSAMIVHRPAGPAAPGWLVAYDSGVQPVKDKEGKVLVDTFAKYKGLCLWIKGDGGEMTAVFTISYGNSKNFFRVPLKDAGWHKVFMPWDKWQEPITGNWWYLTYGLERTDNTKASSYIVDRVHLFTEEQTEQITPTPDNDPPGLVPARAFVSGRDKISKTLEKLKARKTVKIVIAGDSLVTAAQLWYAKSSSAAPNEDVYPMTYWWILGERLKTAYGYDKAACMLRTHNDKEKKWFDTVAQRPVADLQVFAVARGGWTAAAGLEHIEQILNEKPDLVIWEYGINDMINGQPEKYVKATEAAVDKLKAAGIEVVLQTMTTSADLMPHHWLKYKSTYDVAGEASAQTRRIAQAKGCAVADMYAALSCRGIQFVGDIHSDFVHLNHYGHEMFADVLDALLTDRDVRIWKYGPAAEKAKAATRPAP